MANSTVGAKRQYLLGLIKSLGSSRRHQFPATQLHDRALRKAFLELKKAGRIPPDIILIVCRPDGGNVEMWLGREAALQDKIHYMLNASAGDFSSRTNVDGREII